MCNVLGQKLACLQPTDRTVVERGLRRQCRSEEQRSQAGKRYHRPSSHFAAVNGGRCTTWSRNGSECWKMASETAPYDWDVGEEVCGLMSGVTAVLNGLCADSIILLSAQATLMALCAKWRACRQGGSKTLKNITNEREQGKHACRTTERAKFLG